jgi:pimeloyl-ACP methyl ester carboxylesterase
MQATKINDIRLYWELAGNSGEPLVLVHGALDDHHMWDLVTSDLSQSFRVLTYHRRGHSQS